MEEFFWLFVAYSFAGFLLEVAFARLTRAEKQDRKCLLLLPLCPVYGLGAIVVLSLAPFTGGRTLPLFLLGGAAATCVEFCYDLLCERLLHVRFWDYSQFPANLHGRICPLFALFWGLLSVLTVNWLHPALIPVLARLPGWALPPAAALVGLDLLLSLVLLRRTGDTACLCWYRRLPGLSRQRA